MEVELIKDIGHTTHVIFGKGSESKLELPRGNVLLVLSPSIDSILIENFILLGFKRLHKILK